MKQKPLARELRLVMVNKVAGTPNREVILSVALVVYILQ